MRNLIKLTLIFVFAGMVPLQSCDPFDTKCGYPAKKFVVEEMSAEVLIHGKPNSSPADSIYQSADSIFIALKPEKIRYVYSMPAGYPMTFTGTAFACDPGIPKAENTIEAITLKALNDFRYRGRIYEAGETVNGLFYMTRELFREEQPIEDFLHTSNRIEQSDILFLTLRETAYEEQQIKLALSIKLSNNIVSEFNDLQLNVKP